MYRKLRPLAYCLLLAALVPSSCKKTDVFDEAIYKEITETSQPVDSVDVAHTWKLSSSYYMTAEIPATATAARELQILSANPADGAPATILGEYPVSAGEKKYFAFTAPSTMQRFYAALVDDNGAYTVIGFDASQRSINFLQPLATNATVNKRQLSLQTYSYCYEDEMPQPGDYDYNDLVLRISLQRTGASQLTLNVTVAAVGSIMQVAAAMRLLNYKSSDIESITTVGGEDFNRGYKKAAVPYIDSNDLLMTGTDSAAVINLFEDAHWATGAAAYASEGYLLRSKYNVSKTTDDKHDMVSPRTISFVINFKSSVQPDYFTMDQLDPFAIIRYSGALREIHAVHKYRSDMVLYEYRQPDNPAILPWALMVPDGAFRYPLDGVHIGYAKGEALFGAYMTQHHAFGEWAADRLSSTDWYNYPTSNQVY